MLTKLLTLSPEKKMKRKIDEAYRAFRNKSWLNPRQILKRLITMNVVTAETVSVSNLLISHGWQILHNLTETGEAHYVFETVPTKFTGDPDEVLNTIKTFANL